MPVTGAVAATVPVDAQTMDSGKTGEALKQFRSVEPGVGVVLQTPT